MYIVLRSSTAVKLTVREHSSKPKEYSFIKCKYYKQIIWC